MLIDPLAPPPDSPEKPADDPESSFANLPGYLATASGTVLDVGPGTGTFATYLNAPAIKAIYGAEPGVGMHPALMQSARVAGLGDKYQILSCGGERDSLLPALAKAGLFKDVGGRVKQEGVFDTIICIRVLCSVPKLESSLTTLYSLLKPGGRFIICEHVINPWWTAKGSVAGRAFQFLYTLLGWPFFVGDCRLDRDTATLLKQIGDKQGGWESVELNKKMEWTVLPFTSGVYIKKAAGKT